MTAMKKLESIAYDRAKGTKELLHFGDFLNSQDEFAEREDVQKFFKDNLHLCALIGTCGLVSHVADCYAFEFPISGDFSVDLVVGNRQAHTFLFVELEDAMANSVFHRAGAKANRDWGRRFDHGFSQIVDWFCLLDDLKNTRRFRDDFGHGHVLLSGLMLIGRSAHLTDYEKLRLSWRADKVQVDSRHIGCMTYDDLYNALSLRMNIWPLAAQAEDAS